MTLNLIQVFTFEPQRCFNSVNLLHLKKVTESLSWIKSLSEDWGQFCEHLCDQNSELTLTLQINIG